MLVVGYADLNLKLQQQMLLQPGSGYYYQGVIAFVGLALMMQVLSQNIVFVVDGIELQEEALQFLSVLHSLIGFLDYEKHHLDEMNLLKDSEALTSCLFQIPSKVQSAEPAVVGAVEDDSCQISAIAVAELGVVLASPLGLPLRLYHSDASVAAEKLEE